MAKAVMGAGYLAVGLGDYAQAAALGQQAPAVSQAIGDERGMASARLVLGISSMGRGDFGQARALIEAALVWSKKTGNRSFALWGLLTG